MKSLPKPNPKNISLVILGGNLPYVFGNYQFWEHESKPEIWRKELSNSEWEKIDLTKNEGWQPVNG